MISAKSHAKLNLFLHVNGKAENGYHLLDSLVAFTEDIYDEISMELSTDHSLSIDGPYSSCLEGHDNIITKAINMVCKHWNVAPNLKIKLTKNLPIASGIGGGSSNAAVAIKLAQKLLEKDSIENDKELNKILLAIGADVPVCYYGNACYFNGIGEVLTPVVNFPDIWAVLVNPNFAISTPEIFKMGLQDFFKPEMPHLVSFAQADDLFKYLQPTQNDLYFNSLKLSPMLAKIIEAILGTKNCAISRMSGSGATFFGLYETRDFAEEALLSLQEKLPGCFVKMSKLN